jgi:hypothetical protein
MPVEDINRVGPNQDINNPTSLIELAYAFQQKSNNFGTFFHIFQTQDINDWSGGPIFNINIPLLFEDGSTIEYPASEITSEDDILVYDKNLWSNGLIITHINLPEKFRDYWSGINNILELVKDGFIKETSISGTGPFVITFNPGETRTHGSLEGSHFLQADFIPDQSNTTPEWSGSGPINYNSGTYPQLLNEVNNLNIGIVERPYDQNYWYDKYNDGFGSIVFSRAQFGKNLDFIPPLNQQWIQIHNYDLLNSITVNISASVSINGELSASASVHSVAEISGINEFPDGISSSFASYQQNITTIFGASGSPDSSFSTQSRSIEVPPDKSVFIRVLSVGASTFFSSGLNFDVTNSVTINSKTITNFIDL